jgi:hypothetical protein
MKTFLLLIAAACFAFGQTQQENDQFNATFEESKSIAKTAFPDTTVESSKLVMRILALDEMAGKANLELFDDPEKPLILCIIASGEMGISPKLTELDRDQLAIFEKAGETASGDKKLLVSGGTSKPSDGLVPNPLLFMKDSDPVKALSRPRVTPEEAQRIVAEKKAEKENAKKQAQMNAILDDMDQMEQQLQSQQRDMQILNDRQRQQQFDQQAEAWRNRNR